MKRIDSDALGIVTAALGLSGAGAQITELTDAIVDQALDVIPLIRRGRTLGGSQGIFQGALRNIHAGVGDLLTTVAPYEAGADAIDLYPTSVSKLFDIWLLGAFVSQDSGTGTFTGALTVVYPAAYRGFGRDSAGNPVTDANVENVLIYWDSLATEGNATFAITEGGQPTLPIAIRLPRHPSTFVRFRSTASALATFTCKLVLGMFPVALGQDGQV